MTISLFFVLTWILIYVLFLFLDKHIDIVAERILNEISRRKP